MDVAKLLEQLSGSTAWKEALASQNENEDPSDSRQPRPTTEAKSPTQNASDSRGSTSNDGTTTSPSDKVQELLKLLGTGGSSSHESILSPKPLEQNPVPEKPAPKKKDLKELSFVDALEEISKLAKKPDVIKHLAEIRDEQHRLEKRFWGERQQIILGQAARIKELKTKVAITGPLGAREVDRLTNLFNEELSDLEQTEFLPAWDILLSRQQATLERIGIPFMFKTTDAHERQKQQQILAILEGILEKSDSRR